MKYKYNRFYDIISNIYNTLINEGFDQIEVITPTSS